MDDVEKAQKYLSFDFGAWVRGVWNSGYPSTNVLGRVKDEGPGASAPSGKRNYIPIKDCPQRLQCVNVAFMQMPANVRSAWFLHHVKRGDPQANAKKLGCSIATYFRWVKQGRSMIVVEIRE